MGSKSVQFMLRATPPAPALFSSRKNGSPKSLLQHKRLLVVKSSLEPPNVQRLAETSRISATPHEVEEYAPKIRQVVDWFGQLQAIDLQSVEPAIRADIEGDNFRSDDPHIFANRMTLGVYTDEDEKNLKKLLDAFGSIVSLKDIASAYCQTGRDTSATAEILGQKGDSFAGSSTPKSQDCLGTEADAFSWSSDSHLGEVQSAKVKHKRCSTSMGTVAGVIGKEYVKPIPQSKGSSESYKPVKLSSDEIPVTAIWDGKNVSPGNSGPLIGESNSANESMKSDIEEFIYEMLGNGFQMDMTLIQDVVGQCGYNMQMSVDKLLDMSAATLGKSDDVIGMESGINMDNMFGLESTFRRQSPLIDFSGRSNTDIHSRDEFILPWAEKKKKVQREILESLFTVPNKIEEKQASSGPTIRVRRSPYGRSLAKPLKETIVEDFTFISRETVNNGSNKANDKSYEDWRNAVMEYWLMMKEYYKAAVDAFTQKEYEKAKKLVEEGNFYMKKVREADEESCLKIIEDSNEEEEFSINVYHLEPKDALRHLKLQLKSFSGFESIHNLKVVVGTNDGDAQAGKRKRLITKLLEKEKIPWTEEGNGWTISIKVAEIDPDELSFVKK